MSNYSGFNLFSTLFNSEQIKEKDNINTKLEIGIEYESNTLSASLSNAQSNLIYSKALKSFENNSYLNYPIFLVDGFMCSPSMNIWKDLIIYIRNLSIKNHLSCPAIYTLKSGGVSSAYDTAISLFYQIKGGREDFGELHSNKHNHNRYGEEYNGIYKKWSKSNPIHLCAHSFGGNVILFLQKLLEDKIFYNHKTGERYDTDSSWVKSITTLSSPLKGSTSTMFLGHRIGLPGHIDLISPGRFLYGIGHIYEYLNSPILKDHGFDFRLSHFGLYNNKSLFDVIKKSLSLYMFDCGLDSAAYDISIERCYKAKLKTYPNTYYRSYCAKLTNTDEQTKHERPIKHWCLPLADLASKMGKFDLKVDGNNSFLKYENEQALWRANDGIIPLISQFHPEECSSHLCHHFNFNDNNINYMDNLLKGKWYSTTINNCSHVDIIPNIDPPLLTFFNNLSSSIINTCKHISYNPDIIKDYRIMLFDDYVSFLIGVENSIE